jgi:hypothetical protein
VRPLLLLKISIAVIIIINTIAIKKGLLLLDTFLLSTKGTAGLSVLGFSKAVLHDLQVGLVEGLRTPQDLHFNIGMYLYSKVDTWW